MNQLILPNTIPSENQTIKQLKRDGVPIFENKWRRPPEKKATEYLASYKSWVYRATQMNSENTADIELRLKRRVGGVFKDVDTHEALDVLYFGHDLYDFNLMIQLTQTYFELVGENFWWIMPDERGVPTEIVLLRPDLVQIIPSTNDDPNEVIAGYIYRVSGEEIFFHVDEILRFTYPNPLDTYRGKGSVQASDVAIDTDSFSAKYNRDFFYNSAIPKGVFTVDKRLLKKQRKRLEESIQGKLNTKKKAHKPLILESGMNWQELGFKQKDMEFLESRKFSRDEIFSIFGVPTDLINTQNSNRASVTEAINIYLRFTIKQRMKKFVSMLNKYYLPLFDSTLFFDFVDPSPTDTEQSVNIAKAGDEGNFLTVNERRALFGYEPVPGGDVLEQPAIVEGGESKVLQVTNGKIVKSNIQVLKMTVREKVFFDIDVKLKSLSSEIKQITVRKHNMIIEKSELMSMFEYLAKEAKKPVSFTVEQKDVIWKVFDINLQDFEKSYSLRLARYINSQEERLLKQLRSRKDVEIKGVSDINFNLPREKAVYVSIFRKFFDGLISKMGRLTLNFVGDLGVNFNNSNARISKFLSEEAFEQVSNINRNTRDALKKELNEAIKNGESIPQITTRIQSVYAAFRKSRATTIARTETVRAYNFGTLEGYAQSNVVQAKEWLATRDGRTRESHQPGIGVDGEVKPLGKKFSNDVMTPGFDGPAEEVINCRCTTIPVLGQKAYANVVTKLADISTYIEKHEEFKKKVQKEESDSKKKNEAIDLDKLSSELANKLLDKMNE